MRLCTVHYNHEADATTISWNDEFLNSDNRILQLDALGDAINMLTATYDEILSREYKEPK